MKTIKIPSNSRGHANHGWLKTWHSFSFASYYEPGRMHFGKLRVLNDDVIEAGAGFGTHPHNNMEIVTIPLSGALEHKDSMGHTSVIKPGEVQVMSAGTGIEHSEYNHSVEEDCSLMQIWVFPRNSGMTPRYDQKMYEESSFKNNFKVVVNPDTEGGIYIHQDAWFSIGQWDEGKNASYELKRTGNGAYIFIIEGSAVIAGETLSKRDALGIWDTGSFDIRFTENTRLLIIDVPMN